MFCTNCGKELNPGDRFCANCGCEVKASQTEKRQYDNVVFNPPFRMEADKRTAQILKNREEFNGFKEIAKENSKRNARSKAKMDWNLEGFPESITAKNKSGFDWGSVVERKNSGRSIGFEKIDMSSTIENKKIDDAQIEANKAELAAKENLGLPPEDSRVISLEELEKELYDLEEDLKTDTAGTNQYQAFDPQADEELDAYLDGIPKTKKTEKEEEEEKLEAEALASVKLGGPMRWNLADDAAKRAKVSKAPMGLVWGIDPDDLAAKKKAAKAAAKKEKAMVWDTENRVAAKPVEPVKEEPEPEPAAQPEPVFEFKTEPKPEPVVKPEPEPAVKHEPVFGFKAEPERTPEPEIIPEPEVPAELEIVQEPVSQPEPEIPEIKEEHFLKPEPAVIPEPLFKDEPDDFFKMPAADELEEEEPGRPGFNTGFMDTPSEGAEEEPADVETTETAETEIENEFNDMLLENEDEDLEKTRMIDHSEIKRMLDEYKKRLEEERLAEEASAEETVSGAVQPATSIVREERPPYQEEVIHPWEAVTEEQTEAEPAAEVTEETEPEAETVIGEAVSEEPVSEEAVEPAEEEPVHEEPAEEEEKPEEELLENVEETEPEKVDDLIGIAEETVEEKPMFYTFNKQNDAFQQLLQKERDRLNGLGAEYMPLNRDTGVEKIVKEAEKPAYEENGVFVEGIAQPVHTTVADVSGDKMPEMTKHNFMTDGDWLRELRSAKDVESLNKAKKTYSQIFGDPLVKKEEENYDRPEEDEEALKEKQRRAEEFDKFFKEEENEKKKKKEKDDKPKSHVVGNIIMILLILLILFEGSVLAAKLIAPESKYAHISDNIVEKVMDLVHGDDVTVDDGSDQEAATADETTVEEGAYIAMVSDLSKNATTMGEVVYNPDLSYSMVAKSNFEGVESLETLKDAQWTDDSTYAGGVFEAVINYYDEWINRNTDETLVGIDSLELGEIKQAADDDYYILTKTTYASKDGNKAATYQTCYISLVEDSMFINEIKGETVNG